MRTRTLALGLITLGGALACSDAFGVDDALGTWDVRTFNGQSIPGGVWIYQPDGDSAEVNLAQFWFEFQQADACAYTIQTSGDAPFENTDCTYGVVGDGDVTVTVDAEYTLTGSGDGDAMTLTDEDGNVLGLRRR